MSDLLYSAWCIIDMKRKTEMDDDYEKLSKQPRDFCGMKDGHNINGFYT